MSALDTLRAATPLRKTVTTCVDGALQAEWDQALARLDEAGKKDADHGSLAMPETTLVVDELDGLRDRMAASEVTFRFERMGPWTEVALRAEHTPREGNAIDRVRGYNVETYFPALIRASCTGVAGRTADGEEPVFEEIPDDVWDSLLGSAATDDKPAAVGSLNTRQVNDLIAAAEYVNGMQPSVPPSARSLLESQDFGASLAQPGPGMPPPGASADGSPPGSPQSNGTKKATRTKARSAAT